MKIVRSSIPLICIAVASWVSPVWAADAAPVFKIYLEHAGVYEVTFDRLSEAGLEEFPPSAAMGLRNFGVPVPLWIEDGGDGHFGPGDRLIFMGEVLRGTYSYLDPYSRFNCYVLSFDDPEPIHGENRTAAEVSTSLLAGRLARSSHFS